MALQRETMARQAHAEIRRAILEGRYAPGTKLVVRPLTDELGLSPTPIKMALAALAREGLVAERPRRGYYVPTFSEKDIRDICVMRSALDRLAAQLAANRTDRRDLVRALTANLKEQRKVVRSGDLITYADLNQDFHSAIWAASGNSRLIGVADTLLGQVRLLVNTSAGRPGRPRESLTEHAEIITALRNGDAASAATLAGQHACRSEEALLERFGRTTG